MCKALDLILNTTEKLPWEEISQIKEEFYMK
jgi:hypothetical protein